MTARDDWEEMTEEQANEEGSSIARRTECFRADS
jgi:hypothetical protein